MEEKQFMEPAELANLIEHFFKIPDQPDGENLFLTTMEIFRKMQNVHPSERFEPETVCEALMFMDAEFMNGAGDKIFWYLQER